jgi:hypothetical protein
MYVQLSSQRLSRKPFQSGWLPFFVSVFSVFMVILAFDGSYNYRHAED